MSKHNPKDGSNHPGGADMVVQKAANDLLKRASRILGQNSGDSDIDRQIKRQSLDFQQLMRKLDDLKHQNQGEKAQATIADDQPQKSEEYKRVKADLQKAEQKLRDFMAQKNKDPAPLDANVPAVRTRRHRAANKARRKARGKPRRENPASRLSVNYRGLDLAGAESHCAGGAEKEKKPRNILRIASSDLDLEVSSVHSRYSIQLPDTSDVKVKGIPTYSAEWRRHKTVSSVVVMGTILALIGIVLMASAGKAVVGSDAGSAADMLQNITQIKWGAVLLGVAVVVMLLAIHLRKASPKADRCFASFFGRVSNAAHLPALTTGLSDNRERHDINDNKAGRTVVADPSELAGSSAEDENTFAAF